MSDSGPGRWSDLSARVGSAVVLVAIGGAGIWAGGPVFHILTALICGAMVWELARMIDTDTASGATALQLGLLSGGVILLAAYLPGFVVLPVLLAPALVGATRVPRLRGVFALYAAVIALAGFGLISVRDMLGIDWLVWMIGVVVATDIAGYFAGKSLGGPKFWPRVSPKKTWSGTIAGWVAAGAVGAGFALYGGFEFPLVLFSILMAMAAQAGDIAESAIKRRVGVKDSSALIPGHGGFLDRFDGVLGAAVFVQLAAMVFGFPVGA